MKGFKDRLLRAARHAGVGESQAEIARALGTSRQRVNRWFKRESQPTADQMVDIAIMWQVNPLWLQRGEGEMLGDPQGALQPDEIDLLRDYRSATPNVRKMIRSMARAVRKTAVMLALAVPPLLSPKPADASILHNVEQITHWIRRRFACA